MEENQDVIEIIYCEESGFLGKATALAEGIKNKINADVILAGGHRGIFEVWLNGIMIYTNAASSSPLPDMEEIVQALIRAKLMAILMESEESGGCDCGPDCGCGSE